MLLEHLPAGGFDGAPRFPGTEEKGRDILSYIEGEVPAELGWHKDEVRLQLFATAYGDEV